MVEFSFSKAEKPLWSPCLTYNQVTTIKVNVSKPCWFGSTKGCWGPIFDTATRHNHLAKILSAPCSGRRRIKTNKGLPWDILHLPISRGVFMTSTPGKWLCGGGPPMRILGLFIEEEHKKMWRNAICLHLYDDRSRPWILPKIPLSMPGCMPRILHEVGGMGWEAQSLLWNEPLLHELLLLRGARATW